jgi:hypothetical protein
MLLTRLINNKEFNLISVNVILSSCLSRKSEVHSLHIHEISSLKCLSPAVICKSGSMQRLIVDTVATDANPPNFAVELST